MRGFAAGFLGGALGGALVACWLVPRLTYSALRQVTKILLAERATPAPAPNVTVAAVPVQSTTTTTTTRDLPTPVWKSRVVN